MKKFTKYDINCLKALMDKKIKLLRVFPYESTVVGRIWTIQDKSTDDSPLCRRCKSIRQFADKYNLNDNKIVIQVDCGYTCLFIGFYDSMIIIGDAVKPCLYSPKDFPKTEGSWGPGMYVEF